jgi:hypothetical protein
MESIYWCSWWFAFNLLVGGFFSPKRCAEAVPLDAWVLTDNGLCNPSVQSHTSSSIKYTSMCKSSGLVAVGVVDSRFIMSETHEAKRKEPD